MLTAARKIQRKEVMEHYKDLINVSRDVLALLLVKSDSSTVGQTHYK